MSKSKVVTLKDIAKASGVSTATVSYVLNNGPRAVLPATRDRVRSVIEEFGYRPNAAARGLKGKRTHTFGIVFPHEGAEPLANEYFSEVLSGILSVASRRKQVVMLFTGMSWQEIEQNIPFFTDGRCDGFLFLAPPANSRFLTQFTNRNRKIVLLGTRAWGIPVATVDADNVLGGRLATRYLIELGHRKIGMVTADPASTSTPERLQGFREEMAAQGIPVDERLVVAGHYAPLVAEAAAERLLTQRGETGVTAVFCAHDTIAEATIRKARQHGLRVPEDLSVVGFDDLPFASKTDPPLTTVRQPLRDIGAAAASMLLELVDDLAVDDPAGDDEDPEEMPTEQLFDVEVIVRSTTAALRK